MSVILMIFTRPWGFYGVSGADDVTRARSVFRYSPLNNHRASVSITNDHNFSVGRRRRDWAIYSSQFPLSSHSLESLRNVATRLSELLEAIHQKMRSKTSVRILPGHWMNPLDWTYARMRDRYGIKCNEAFSRVWFRICRKRAQMPRMVILKEIQILKGNLKDSRRTIELLCAGR
jgi:hypothetical protein